MQLILSHIEVVDPAKIEPEDYLPQAPRTSRLTAKLREILLSIGNPHLRGARRVLLDRRGIRPQVHHAAGGISNHHAYHAGLLEHVVTILTIADRIVDLYPELDRDLLLTGIFLHDIGKVSELSDDRAFAYR